MRFEDEHRQMEWDDDVFIQHEEQSGEICRHESVKTPVYLITGFWIF